MKETGFLQATGGLVEQMRQIPFLSNFSKDHLCGLLSSSKIRTFEPNETIVEESARDTWVYVIIAGEVNVSRGHTLLSTMRNTGEVFGEMALVGNHARAATIRAVSQTTCLALDISSVNANKPDEQAAFLAIMFRLLAQTLADRLVLVNQEMLRLRQEHDMLTHALHAQKK